MRAKIEKPLDPTEMRMAAALWRRRRSSWKIALTHYTPKDWWECDVYAVTNSGYSVEYEVKVTRADFLADFEKKECSDVFGRTYSQRLGRILDRKGGDTHYWAKKHEILAARQTRSPSRFFFVTPVGIVTLEDIPEYAGWIEMVPSGSMVEGDADESCPDSEQREG